MLDTERLRSIASQMMSGAKVEVDGQKLPVRRVGAHRLKTVSFTMDGRKYTAIEQNPDKPSRWGQLARQGHQVVQFKDVERNRFVAVAVDGEVKEYGAIRTQRTGAKGDRNSGN
jgi:hypothetical protein